MTRRFTVIQGGLSEVSAAGATTARRRDRFAAETVEAAAVGACRSTRVVNAPRDPRRGFDHRMPPAQHRSAFRAAGLAVAWNRDAERESDESPRAAILPGSASLRGEYAGTGPQIDCAPTAAAETAVARAVDRALRARLANLRGPIRLVGSVEPVRAAIPSRSASATGAAARPRAIPAGAFVGTRPQGWTPPVSEEADGACGIGERSRASDATTAVRPSIAEPSEIPSSGAARSRIVLFGGLSLGLLRRVGGVIARALRPGAAGARLPWRPRSGTVNPPRAAAPVVGHPGP